MSSPSPQAPRPRPVLLVLEEDPARRGAPWGDLGETHDVRFATSSEEARQQLSVGGVDLAIVDDVSGDPERAYRLRDEIAQVAPAVPVVLLVSSGDEEQAVEALRRGFVDFMVKRDDRLRVDLMRKRIDANLEMARLQSENARLHRAIEESQARLFNVYDSLDDVIIQIDHDCKVVSMNRSAAAIASIEPRQGIGRTCWQMFDFFPCEKREKKDLCPIFRTFAEGETLRGVREDARTKSVAQYMTFITTLRGQDYSVYRETDITEKRRLEERIASALRSLGAGPDSSGGA